MRASSLGQGTKQQVYFFARCRRRSTNPSASSLATYSAKADPIAKLMLGLMGSVAEFERSIIKERQAEGIAHAKARGVYKGRVKALTDVQVAQA